jgi:hypothetical protein
MRGGVPEVPTAETVQELAEFSPHGGEGTPWFRRANRWGIPSRVPRGGSHMIAALNLGIIGTIIVVVLIIAVVLFFLRRT